MELPPTADMKKVGANVLPERKQKIEKICERRYLLYIKYISVFSPVCVFWGSLKKHIFLHKPALALGRGVLVPAIANHLECR